MSKNEVTKFTNSHKVNLLIAETIHEFNEVSRQKNELHNEIRAEKNYSSNLEKQRHEANKETNQAHSAIVIYLFFIVVLVVSNVFTLAFLLK